MPPRRVFLQRALLGIASLGGMAVAATRRRGGPMPANAAEREPADTIQVVPGAPNIGLLPTLASLGRAGADMSLNATYRAAAAGDNWLDPVTQVRIVKLTDARYPAANAGCGCPYSEGGPFISRKWGDSHTVNVRTGSGTNYLIDVARSGGTTGRVSNPRSVVLSEVNSGFSYATSSPTRIYNLDGSKLFAFDARNPAARLNLPHIPRDGKDFSAYMRGFPYLGWLTVTENDEWLVFQCEPAGVVIAYNVNDGTTRTKTWPDLNQPQAVRHAGDNHVILCGNTYRKAGVWNHRLDTFVENTHLYSGHPAPIRGGMAEYDPTFSLDTKAWPEPVDCFTYDAARNVKTQRATAVDINAYNTMHKCSQWINGATADTEWFQSTSEETPMPGLSWSPDGGSVYRASTSLGYDFNAVGITSVVQGPAGKGGPASWSATLTNAKSRRALVEGSWYCDRNKNSVTVYVWTLGGVPPQDVVSTFASSGNALGVAWHQANARDARLVCHSRCYISDYASNVFGTMSPDGLAVMFSSNMGVRGGRVDAYLALISPG